MRDEKEDLARFILRLRFDWKVSILWIEHDLQMVSDLADRVCDGTTSPLVRAFVQGRRFSSQDIAELRQLLDELERKGRKG